MTTSMTRQEWVDAFAVALGVGVPTDNEIDQILELAAIAAHSSERTSAPVACWIAAKMDLSLPEILNVAQAVAGDAPESDNDDAG